MTEPEGGEIDTIEVSKRRLRSALRQARTKAGLTQKAVAKQLSWSISKIVRIELGAVPVTPTDVDALLRLYGSTADEVTRLTDLAKEIRSSKGSPELDEVMSAAYKELLAHERVASAIFMYEPGVVAGLLQTQDYTRALLRAVGRSAREVDLLLEVRNRRQRLFEEPDRPELNIIIGEAALRRPVGGHAVMHEQMNHLLAMNDRYEDRVNLWVLPFSVGPHRSMGNAFTVMEFDDPELPEVLYLEGSEFESLSREDQGEIEKYREIYGDLQVMAEGAGPFDELINHIAVPLYNG